MRTRKVSYIIHHHLFQESSLFICKESILLLKISEFICSTSIDRRIENRGETAKVGVRKWSEKIHLFFLRRRIVAIDEEFIPSYYYQNFLGLVQTSKKTDLKKKQRGNNPLTLVFLPAKRKIFAPKKTGYVRQKNRV